MSDPNQPLDYYKILGISPDATQEEIRRAYRRLSLQWHPDRNSTSDAPHMMRLINLAWDTLGDPNKRADYDRGRPGNDSDVHKIFNWYRSEILPLLLENAVDLYEILGVSHNSTFEDIQDAYEFRQSFLADAPVPMQDPSALDLIRTLVLDARIVLGDPHLRAEYDQHYFLLRSKVAEAGRRAQEEESRERERLERERQRAEMQRHRTREERERRVREEHDRRERERLTLEKWQRKDQERETRERRVQEEHERREREKHRAEMQRHRTREERERRVREEHDRRERERLTLEKWQRKDQERETRERRVQEEHERREREKHRAEMQRRRRSS